MTDIFFSDGPQSRRAALLALAAAASGVAGLPTAARAQQPPTPAFRPVRPVRIMSPQLAGGSTDAVLRPLAQRLSALWGQPVLVDNRPGGGSVIATLAVVQAPADGHTLGLAINPLTINPSLRNDLPYDTLRDITPITQIGSTTVALVVHPSLGVSTLDGFIAHARAAPGSVAWASLGIGTGGHITGELLARRAGIQLVHVPFSGSSGAYRELLPGRVQAGFVVLDSALPHIEAGTLRLLAVTDPRRNSRYPGVPALEETFKGMAYDGIFGLIAPPALPPLLLQQLHADITGVLALPEVRQQLAHQAMDVLASSPAEFALAIRREIAHWRTVVAESGAQVR